MRARGLHASTIRRHGFKVWCRETLGYQIDLSRASPIAHVPYKGAARATVNVVGGHVPMMFTRLGVASHQEREAQAARRRRFLLRDESKPKEALRIHSGLIPVVLTTFCHFAISWRISAASSCRLLLVVSRPCRPSRSRTSSVRSNCTTS